MSEIVKFFTQSISQMPDYPLWLYWATLCAIVGLTQLAKLPIKHFTNKIKNETTRQRVNLVIMIIPFALAMGASAAYMLLGYDFSVEVGLTWGFASQVLYEFIAKIFARVKDGKEITEETITDDFKESVENAKTAEKEFEELVDKLKKTE